MIEPARHDEITGLVVHVDEQLTHLRSAALGLTEEQARETPCRSALSVGGIVKHVNFVLRGALDRLGGSFPVLDEAGYALFADSFAVRDDETVAAALEELDRLRPRLLEAMAATDPAADAVEPPAPWDGRFETRPIRARHYLVHLIEELARHAGHADIVREQIDGVAVPALVHTLAGTGGTEYQPYRPAAGTLLA